jgi:hypothetical protein
MLNRLHHTVALTIASALLATSASAAPLARAPLPIGSDGLRASSYSTFGPVLAGDAVVFGTLAGGDGTPAHLLAASTGGGPARELPGPWSRLSGGAAGILARSEVVTAGGEDRYSPVYTAHETLVAGAVDGPARTLGTCIAPVAADGARVVYVTGARCDAIVVLDVLADRELARWPAGAEASLSAGDASLRLAGDRVSWKVGDSDGAAGVMVGDVATGVVRREPQPADARAYALAPDGTLAFLVNTGFQEDWKDRLVVRAAGGADREIAAWSAWASDVSLLAFSGDDLVVRVRQQARAGELREASDRVLALAPDGAVRTLLRAQPPRDAGRSYPGQALIGTDVEGVRIAWMLRDCDEAAVGAAAIADLPPGGLDATAPEHCVRPVLERRTLRLDRRARTTVAVRCPAACSGRLTLTGVNGVSGVVENTYRRLATRAFSLGAGRHRIAVLLSDLDRAWVAHGRGHARSAQLALSGITGTRPSSRVDTVRMVAG